MNLLYKNYVQQCYKALLAILGLYMGCISSYVACNKQADCPDGTFCVVQSGNARCEPANTGTHGEANNDRIIMFVAQLPVMGCSLTGDEFGSSFDEIVGKVGERIIFCDKATRDRLNEQSGDQGDGLKADAKYRKCSTNRLTKWYGNSEWPVDHDPSIKSGWCFYYIRANKLPVAGVLN